MLLQLYNCIHYLCKYSWSLHFYILISCHWLESDKMSILTLLQNSRNSAQGHKKRKAPNWNTAIHFSLGNTTFTAAWLSTSLFASSLHSFKYIHNMVALFVCIHTFTMLTRTDATLVLLPSGYSGWRILLVENVVGDYQTSCGN